MDKGHPRIDMPDTSARRIVDGFVSVEDQVDGCHEEERLADSLADVDNCVAEEEGVDWGFSRVDVVLDEDEDDSRDRT